MTNIWTPNGNRVAALGPGPEDLFVVTTMFGKRVFVEPVGDYDRALKIAEAFARQMTRTRPFTVKLQCMSFDELLASMGMTEAQFINGMAPEVEQELKQLAVDACMRALRECNEPSVRADALKVLIGMGVVQPVSGTR